MSRSIMQDDKKCFITGAEFNLDKHHCFHGPRRKAAEKWGCWVWMRHDVHMMLHSTDTELDEEVKKACQERFEELYGHAKFMEVFGKSYL